MDNETTTSATKLGSDGVEPTTTASSDLEHNPNSNSPPSPSPADPHNEATESDSTSLLQPPPGQSSRTSFTNISQIDADFLLARTIQEQERAYLVLSSRSGSWGFGYHHDHTESDDDDDWEEFGGSDVTDDEVVNDEVGGENSNPNFELDSGNFSSDEAYARALQDAEERESTARLVLLAGIQDEEPDEWDDQGENDQGTWSDVDPDELSYEELLALGEVIGTESKGLSADSISSLPSVNFKAGSSETGSNDLCVICRFDFEDDETLTVLSCKHSYHSECINNWLRLKKVCPVCNAEVSTATANGTSR